MSSILDILDKYKYIICGVAIIIVIIIVVLLCLNTNKKEEGESYIYNKLDKQTIVSILSKPCNLSLREYTNILNSTQNLRSLFLQQICNNYVCDNYDIKTTDELLSLIKTIAAERILKCIRDNDIYRLSLINLKINDMIASVIPGYVIFKRALTSGVYADEHVNIYIGNEEVSVKDIVNTTIKNITPITDEKINETFKGKNVSEKDRDLYENYVEDFINKVQNSKHLRNNQENSSKDFPIDLFAVISTINIYRVFTVNSLQC